EAPEARRRRAVEAELAVGDVLDDQEPVAPRELDERAAPFDRERHARWILMVRDRVQELRPQPAGQTAREVVDVEAVLVERHGDDVGLEAVERHDRADVGRALDQDGVSGVEERLGDELERLDPTARDQQLVVARPRALLRLESRRERVTRTGEAVRRGVLERRGVSRLGELRENRSRTVRRERPRIRETARERDELRIREQTEN